MSYKYKKNTNNNLLLTEIFFYTVITYKLNFFSLSFQSLKRATPKFRSFMPLPYYLNISMASL